jgi:sigma-B regulation protein RsbU (phosphoserine phosphatase)
MVDVQQRLLRCYIPTFENIECSAMCRQAEAVGGDFYDVFRLPSGDIVLAIGDVSGKGLGAALMMATIQATVPTGNAEVFEMMEITHLPATQCAFCQP